MRPFTPEMPLLRGHHSGERLKNLEAICTPERAFRCTLRMRHHSQDVPPLAADTGNVVERSIRISLRRNLSRRRAVPEYDSIVALEFSQCALVAEVIAFHVADGNTQHLALPACIGKWRIAVFNPHMDRLADVFQTGVAH